MGRPKKYNTEEERKVANREAQKRYYEHHKNDKEFKDARKTYMVTYYQSNKEELAAKKAEHYSKNKEEILAKQAEYRSTPFGRAMHLVRAYRKEDKKNNRGECIIDAQWVVDNVFSGQCCVYCGEPDWTKLGVDRKDSTKPHTPENCVPCCKACNNKKQKTPYEEYMRMIGKIA